MLEARGVTRSVWDGDREATILHDVSLTIEAGERLALLGPSGCGKSTLLHILGGLDADYQGSVRVAGTALEGLSDRELAALRNGTLGFVFQSYNLLGHLSALDNVLLPARFGANGAEPARAVRILEELGLGDKVRRRPATLSGGERQRVAIARALYSRPKVVLCDEPTGNLDRETASEILDLFNRLTAEGVALLVATHDDAIAHTAHRTIRLLGGRLR
ncbi:MAG: ABC transporter ATP-binding protein [Deltaproteobacteria bacterium]|nr:ABC transporter ATP-binding protein [Deltaproteobacteria bacterium]